MASVCHYMAMPEINAYFNVIHEEDRFVLLGWNLPNIAKFCEDYFSYFFDRAVLDRYFEQSGFDHCFEPSPESLSRLYLDLCRLFGSEYRDPTRVDKGTMGEYCLNVLLQEYFKNECLVVKLLKKTSLDMAVFGIDSLYYDERNDLFLFGEAKFCETLDSAISNAKATLNKYDEMLDEEYVTLSEFHNRPTAPNSTLNRYKKCLERAISFDEFVSEASISKIGVPIFLGCGSPIEKDAIIASIKSVTWPSTIKGLNAVYYFFAIPVGDFESFFERILERIGLERTKLISEREAK